MADIHKDELRNVIENAESFLRSSMTSPIGYPGQEALVYMMSRRHTCDDAIQEVKERWKTDSKASPFGNKWRFWCKYDPYVIFYDSAMVRTAERCGIGGYEDYWKYIYEHTEHYHSDYRKLDFFPYFPYFRSEKLTTNMSKQLEMTLAGYVKNVTGMHDWKDFSFKDKQEYDFQGQYYVNTLQIATLIFGAHQIQSRMVDSEFLAKSTEYLLKSQLNNGSWWDDSKDARTAGVYQSSIAIHALCITKPEGYEHCARMARKWLVTQQHSDGYWEDMHVPCKVFLTVLVLDALELAGGGKCVTFQIKDNDKDRASVILGTDNKSHSIVKSGVEKLEIEVSVKSNSVGRPKNDKSKAKANKQPPRTPVKPWRNTGDAAFLITEEGRIEFYYKEEKKDLRMGHKSRAYKLLRLLSGDKGLDSTYIKKRLCTEGTKPYHCVRDVNKAILNKIKAAGFVGIPKDVAIIVHDEEADSYSSLIPISSIDDYDRQYIRNETRLPEGDDEDDDYSDHYNELDNK